jgi:hypothetical protein
MVAGGFHNIAEFQPSLREPKNPVQPAAVVADLGKALDRSVGLSRQRVASEVSSAIHPGKVISATHFGKSP